MVWSLFKKKNSKDDDDSEVDASLYKSIIDSLFYLSTTKLGIKYVATALSRFIQPLCVSYLSVAKMVLRYIRGTIDHEIWYLKDINDDFQGYVDSD